MQIDAVPDSLRVHVGTTFSHHDVERLREAFVAFAPFSSVDIDFADVHHCDDSALARLATALARFDRGVVRVHGLSARQWRLLLYAGFDGTRPA